MELSKEQLLQIDNYIYSCGIKFYDVKAEIVDHFANILEEKLDKNPDLNFKKEIEDIHRNFSDNGFQKLLKEKTKSVQKKFYKQSFKHFITFFKLPKIIISGALFYGLLQMMNLFEDKENFFTALTASGLLLSVIILFREKDRNNKKEKFLTLGMTVNFLNIFHFLVVTLQYANNRSIESLSNSTHNYLLIASYILLFLFFWSGEYVFSLNKKEVQKQYPNVIV